MSELSDAFAERLLKGEADWRTLTLTVLLVDEDYVFDPEVPELPEEEIATSAALTGLDVVARYATAEAAYFETIEDDREIVAALIVEDGDTPIAFLDEVVGLPWIGTPGAPYYISWPQDRVFRL